MGFEIGQLIVLNAALRRPARPGTAQTVEDVMRRNDTLLGESDNLRAELQRLKRENADLLEETKVGLVGGMFGF